MQFSYRVCDMADPSQYLTSPLHTFMLTYTLHSSLSGVARLKSLVTNTALSIGALTFFRYLLDPNYDEFSRL